MAIVDFEQVTKAYRVHPGTRVLFGKGGLATLLSRQAQHAMTVALEEFTFSIELGECLGIEGTTGAGKTTLLRLIAGITAPTSGKVTVLGRVASLIEPDFGLEPRLSGRENSYLHCRFQGLSRKESNVVMETIQAFAGLDETLDDPVASYSLGMRVQLAFAIAAHTSPDILLMDSVLGLADDAFGRKCVAALSRLKEQGKTLVVVVDPAHHELRSLCDRVLALPIEPPMETAYLEPAEAELPVAPVMAPEPESYSPPEDVDDAAKGSPPVELASPEAEDAEELKLERDDE